MFSQLDIAWTITAALLVYFMHGGFGFYEAGMCSAKNTVDTLSHNLIILSLTVVIYWAVGFGLMFGHGNGIVGLSGFFPRLLDSQQTYPELAKLTVPLVVSFAMTMSFADTPATLIAGTGAERIRFAAVMILTLIISGLLFPIVGHWILGGGWLTKLSVPVYDTGSGFIHLCGGCCALAVAIVIGPRQSQDNDQDQHEGRTKDDPSAQLPKAKKKPVDSKRQQVSSMPLVFLGAFILWLGFFAFNAGLAMHVSGSIALVMVNTALAGSSGAVMAIFVVFLVTGKARLRTSIVGLLTACVAVTTPSAVVEPWAAVVIGMTAGAMVVGLIPLWIKLKLDDPTEYLTMNVAGGLLGMLSVGILASPDIMHVYPQQRMPLRRLCYGGGFSQSLTQLIAIGAIIGFTLSFATLACYVLKRLGLLRVQHNEEAEGSDRTTHGEKAYDQDVDS